MTSATQLPLRSDELEFMARPKCPCGWHFLGNGPGFCAIEDEADKGEHTQLI